MDRMCGKLEGFGKSCHSDAASSVSGDSYLLHVAGAYVGIQESFIRYVLDAVDFAAA